MQKVGTVLVNLMQDLSRLSTNGEAHIRVNDQLCEPEQFEALFGHFTRGTILERINLHVEELDTRVECSCGYREQLGNNKKGYTKCPECGKFAEVKNDAYELVSPDPSRAGMRKSIKF